MLRFYCLLCFGRLGREQAGCIAHSVCAALEEACAVLRWENLWEESILMAVWGLPDWCLRSLALLGADIPAVLVSLGEPPCIQLSLVGLFYACNPISRVTGCHPAAGRALSEFSERGGLWWRGFAELLWQPTSLPPSPSLVPSFPISLAIHPAV